MIRKLCLTSLFGLLLLSPLWLMGAVCSRAIDIPILVTANLPNKNSSEPFVLDVDSALRKAGIQPQGDRIPAGVPESVTLEHQDSVDLRSEQQIQSFGSRIQEIHINAMQVEMQENTLSTPLPAIQIAVSSLPVGTTTTPLNHVKVAEISGIPAKTLGSLPNPVWEEAGLKQLGETLRQFALMVQLKTTIRLKAGDPWPSGKAQFQLKLQFAFVIKPI